MLATVPKSKSLGSILAVLGIVRKSHPTMTVENLMVLLKVAQNPDIRQSDLAKDMEMSPSVSSRNIAELSEVKLHGQPGLGFLDSRPDIMDRRHKQLSLTKDGEKFVSRLEAVVD
ncbi:MULTISPECIES: hypothetical protein [Roseomonas]|jgi:DNA-binding MarR family transcriptional regulator|nr:MULTISPECIES: hypothetical protein [Roseomonas]